MWMETIVRRSTSTSAPLLFRKQRYNHYQRSYYLNKNCCCCIPGCVGKLTAVAVAVLVPTTITTPTTTPISTTRNIVTATSTSTSTSKSTSTRTASILTSKNIWKIRNKTNNTNFIDNRNCNNRRMSNQPILVPPSIMSETQNNNGESKNIQSQNNDSTTKVQLQIHDTIESIQSIRRVYDMQIVKTTSKRTTQSRPVQIGFVPTMGALHDGHVSLIETAVMENDIVFVSIFINPTQFAPTDDLTKYPRTIDNDIQLLKKHNVHHVFIPTNTSIMYQPNHITFVVPEGFDEVTKEGRVRPGHFQGVATIVVKLLNLIRPTTAYFGQKDATQCVLIQRIVHDLNINTNISIVPTVRHDDGLAMSSRNVYLTSYEQRTAASVLYKSLQAAQTLYEQHKSKVLSSVQQQQQNEQNNNDDNNINSIPSKLLQQEVHRVLLSEPLVSEIQYISIDSKETMTPIDNVYFDTNQQKHHHHHHQLDGNTTNTSTDNCTVSTGAVVSIAVKIGTVRLIDNIVL